MVEITYYWRHVFVQEGGWQVGGWYALNLQRLEPHSICKILRNKLFERRKGRTTDHLLGLWKAHLSAQASR